MAVDCCVDLGHIEKFCGGVNAPGLDRRLSIACGDHVTSIANATGHRITGDIKMRVAVVAVAAVAADPSATPPVVAVAAVAAVAAEKMYTWNFSKEDQEFKSVQDENGLWKTNVKIFIPKLDAEKSNILNNSTGDDKIVVVKDRNGKSRLIGSLSEGCEIKVTEQTTPKNGYIVEITWESAHSPYFFEGNIV